MDVKALTHEEIKTLQAIMYILSFFRAKGTLALDRVKLIKLLWAADRYHIRKYGRLILSSKYCAMRHGPVNSLAEDIAKSSDYLSDSKKQDIACFIHVIDNGVELSGSGVANDDYEHLSDTDKEALDFAIDSFGDEKTFELANVISHKYPEWAKYEKEITSDPKKSYIIDILDFFNNPDDDQYFASDKETLMSSEEIFKEQQKISQMLRG